MVRTSLAPSLGHRSEPSFFAVALETEPTITEFGCDGDRASERSSAAFGSSPTFETKFPLGIDSRGNPSIDFPPLRRRWRDEPHFPPLARRVEKSPVTHRHVLRRTRAPKWVCLQRLLCTVGATTVHIRVIRRRNHARGTYVFEAARRGPLSAWVESPAGIEVIEIQ